LTPCREKFGRGSGPRKKNPREAVDSFAANKKNFNGPGRRFVKGGRSQTFVRRGKLARGFSRGQGKARGADRTRAGWADLVLFCRAVQSSPWRETGKAIPRPRKGTKQVFFLIFRGLFLEGTVRGAVSRCGRHRCHGRAAAGPLESERTQSRVTQEGVVSMNYCEI